MRRNMEEIGERGKNWGKYREWVREKKGVELVNGSDWYGVVMAINSHNKHTSSDSTPKNSFSLISKLNLDYILQ